MTKKMIDIFYIHMNHAYNHDSDRYANDHDQDDCELAVYPPSFHHRPSTVRKTQRFTEVWGAIWGGGFCQSKNRSQKESAMSAMAKAQKAKGDTFTSQAEALLNKKSWFGSKTKNAEEAAEIYEQAANAYKVGGLNHEAGDAYLKAAALYRDTLSDFNSASKALNNAGTSYKKSSPIDAVQAYRQAVSLYVDNARITQAAKLSKEIGELFENEQMDEDEKSSIVLAIEAYEQAAEFFGMEDSKSNTSQCLAKVAELCSAGLEPPDFVRASSIYDDLGRRCLDSNLLKFNAKGYFLQAIFCQLGAGDAVGASQSLNKFGTWDYTFGDSREGKFANALIESVEGLDVEGFSTACYDFDRISKLNPWQTAILVSIKKSIDEGGDGDDDDIDLT